MASCKCCHLPQRMPLLSWPGMSGLPGQHVQMSSEKHPLPLIACKNALLANAVICLHDSQLQSRLQPYRREFARKTMQMHRQSCALKRLCCLEVGQSSKLAQQNPVKIADIAFGGVAAGGMLPPTPPNAAYQPMPGSSDAGSSTSSATFPYLPSGSPQLPFAFTPSPHSLPTLAGQVRPFMLDNAYRILRSSPFCLQHVAFNQM